MNRGADLGFKSVGRLCAGVLGALLLTGAQASASPPPVSAPCTAAVAACSEWVRLGTGGARSMIYRSYPLGKRNRGVRRALIMVHGALRNADHYFTTASGAAFLAGALGDTIIIAPAFRSAEGECKDALAPDEVSWSCGGDSWKSGGASPRHPALTSFDFLDEVLGKLADRRVFPNLEIIVLAGHSAGGQFVTRYEMANKVHEHLGVHLVYVVANPSSYAWPNAARPLPTGDAAPASAATGWKSEIPHTAFTFGAFDPARAPNYDQWPYGLENRTGYAARLSDEALRAQLVGRPTTYLLGQVDTLPLGGFDDSLPAMAQGPTRRARGEAFVKYLNDRLGAQAKVVIVPECGHNDRCIFTSEAALPVIFPAL
jgi:pimeloyl-ACP methyl ester carboxylesterase